MTVGDKMRESTTEKDESEKEREMKTGRERKQQRETDFVILMIR